jgi:hypothetical protein
MSNEDKSIFNFDIYSSELIVIFNKNYNIEDNSILSYSQYGTLYYSWTNISLSNNIKQYNILNIIPNTNYVIKFNNVIYHLKSLSEHEEILKLKLELNNIKTNSNSNENYESIINLHKKRDIINKGLINKLSINIKNVCIQNEELKTKINQLEAENSEELKTQINKLNNENAELKKNQELLITKNNELRSHQEILINEICDLKANQEILNNEIYELDNINNKYSILTHEYDVLKQKYQEFLEEYDDAIFNSTKNTIKISKLIEDNNILKNEKEQLKKKINGLLLNGLTNIAQKWA